MPGTKWTADDISKFLDIYQQHEILWNINHKDNANKLKRETAFDKLLQETRNTVKDTTLEDLKNKIKIIRTVYRKELRKVEKAKTSGTGTDLLYTPRLSWYSKADAFLNQSIITRATVSNLDIEEMSDVEDNTSEPEDIDDTHITNTPDMINSGADSEQVKSGTKRCYKKSAQTMNPPKEPVVKKKCNSKVSAVESAITQLDKVVDKFQSQNNKQEDEFDNFAKYIATQLRKLPPRSAIIVQQQIQNFLTDELLRCIPLAPGHQLFSPFSSTHSAPISYDSNYSSTTAFVPVPQLSSSSSTHSSTCFSYYDTDTPASSTEHNILTEAVRSIGNLENV